MQYVSLVPRPLVAAPPGHRLVARQVQQRLDHRHGMAACAPRDRAASALVEVKQGQSKGNKC